MFYFPSEPYPFAACDKAHNHPTYESIPRSQIFLDSNSGLYSLERTRKEIFKTSKEGD